MPRTDFQSLTAPKLTVAKIEQYMAANGIRSKSQALASIMEQVEKQQSVGDVLAGLISALRVMMENITSEAAFEKMRSGFEALVKTILTFLQSFAVSSTSSKRA